MSVLLLVSWAPVTTSAACDLLWFLLLFFQSLFANGDLLKILFVCKEKKITGVFASFLPPIKKEKRMVLKTKLKNNGRVHEKYNPFVACGGVLETFQERKGVCVISLPKYSPNVVTNVSYQRLFPFLSKA